MAQKFNKQIDEHLKTKQKELLGGWTVNTSVHLTSAYLNYEPFVENHAQLKLSFKLATFLQYYSLGKSAHVLQSHGYPGYSIALPYFEAWWLLFLRSVVAKHGRKNISPTSSEWRVASSLNFALNKKWCYRHMTSCQLHTIEEAEFEVIPALHETIEPVDRFFCNMWLLELLMSETFEWKFYDDKLI